MPFLRGFYEPQRRVHRLRPRRMQNDIVVTRKMALKQLGA